MPGLFVTFEGIDRSGKTTQARLLCEALGDEAVAVREPGGTPVGERVRELLKDPSLEIEPATEALLFAAARADHVARTIRPALERGAWVLSDRFLDSSLAYQGGAAGVGIDSVRRLHDIGSGGFLPDRTLLLELPPAAVAERLSVRDAGGSDRIGGREGGFHERVAEAFAALAEAEPDRFRRVDASGPAGAVTARLLAALEDLLRC